MSRADALSWNEALTYYRERGAVLFLSYCRFWEQHGFVQQSLAQTLSQEGVEVIWFDGSGWRPYRPTVRTPSQRLSVLQLPQLPLRRIPLVETWDRKSKSAFLRQQIRRLGGNPVIWVQAGIEEGLARELPYIDVFSVFDDPYRHAARGSLCKKARVVVCQNTTAREQLADHASKTRVLLPPMDLSDGLLETNAEAYFPPGFPRPIFGYVGSFQSDGFDLALLERFIVAHPDRGFVLMGRSDPAGLATVQRWKHRYPNFHYFPWVPRNQVASVWKQMRVTLLFYKANRTQDGAFPVKIAESLRFGIPCVATAVPKTADLEGVFPRAQGFEALEEGIEEAMAFTPEQLRQLYGQFAAQMDPRQHLAEVATSLQWNSEEGKNSAPELQARSLDA